MQIRDAIGSNDLRVQPPDLEVKNLSPYRENYFQILSEEPKPFNLKRGLFTNFVDEKLPFDRERKSYDPDKEYSLHGRRSSSKDLTSIYYRAHTISKDRTQSQLSGSLQPLAEVRQVGGAEFSADPEYLNTTSLNKFDSTLTFSKVLEPIRLSTDGRFDDYQSPSPKKYKSHRKTLQNSKKALPSPLPQRYPAEDTSRCTEMSVKKLLRDLSPVKSMKKFLSPSKFSISEMKKYHDHLHRQRQEMHTELN